MRYYPIETVVVLLPKHVLLIRQAGFVDLVKVMVWIGLWASVWHHLIAIMMVLRYKRNVFNGQADIDKAPPTSKRVGVT